MNTTKAAGRQTEQKIVFYKQEAEEWGDFPLLTIHPVKLENKHNYNLTHFAYACNLTVFRTISEGNARILNYDFSLKSIFSLKCHFHSNGAKFTYRSDKYPGDVNEQYERLLKLAKDNMNLTYSMQLYDNRRTAPDDLLINWKGGEIILQHDYLPCKTKATAKDIDRVNLFSKAFFPKL